MFNFDIINLQIKSSELFEVFAVIHGFDCEF